VEACTDKTVEGREKLLVHPLDDSTGINAKGGAPSIIPKRGYIARNRSTRWDRIERFMISRQVYVLHLFPAVGTISRSHLASNGILIATNKSVYWMIFEALIWAPTQL
jgi:hypothetical protein